MAKSITLKEIAAITGHSISTVSKALNNSPEVSEKTRHRILEVARSSNYFLNNKVDHSLLCRKLRMVGLLIPDVANPYFARLWTGIEDIARANDYAVVACHTCEDPTLEKKQIARLERLDVEGILAIPVNEENYRDTTKPLVFLSRCDITEQQHSYVINNDFRGAYLAVKYLLDQGKKNIFFLSGPKDISVARSRAKGMQTAFREKDLVLTKDNIIYDNLTMKDGRNATESIVRKYHDSIGIFCSSDVVATGALYVARVNNLRIPEDISIVGYDNLEQDSYLDYPLTTIGQADYQIGAQGMKSLLTLLNPVDGLRQSQQITFEPEILIRKT